MNLIYTIAFDAPNAPFHQAMAKILVSSIFRAGFSGDVLILTNSPHRVFEFGRANVEEVSLDTHFVPPADLDMIAHSFKYRARKYVEANRYERVMFVACDSFFQKNPDTLFSGTSEIRCSEGPLLVLTGDSNKEYVVPGEMGAHGASEMDSGVWWIGSEHYDNVMTEWERIDSTEPGRQKDNCSESAWGRLLRDTKLRVEPFQRGVDIQYPAIERRTLAEFADATMVRFVGMTERLKLSHIFGNYMRRFRTETCFGLLEGTEIDDMTTFAIPNCTEIWRSTENVPGWFAEEEMRALILMTTLALSTSPGEVLEIGSYKGRATIALARTLQTVAPGRRVYALDPGTGEWVSQTENYWETLRGNIAAAGVSEHVQCVQCSPSLEGLDWKEPLAFVLIDGAHGFLEVQRDFELIADHVSPGGIVAFHDDTSHFPGVAILCRQMERRYRWSTLLKAGTLSFFRKPLAGRPKK